MGKPANASADCSINNIYRLEGRVPIGKAIPFGEYPKVCVNLQIDVR